MIEQNMTGYWSKRLQTYNLEKPDNDFYQFQNLIDIIIPVYNDRIGLYETLFSLNILHKYHVIIVDDCSTESYDDIISLFRQFLNITYVHTPSNGGPAVAKNYGVQFVTNKYLMFLDAGDTLVHTNVLAECERILEQDNNPVLRCASYQEMPNSTELELIPADTNMWIGKIYNTNFFKQYDLKFVEDTSFCNDDIGMNMFIGLLLPHESISFIETPMLIWHDSSTSVTRKDKDKYNLADSPMGSAKSALYAIDKAKKYHINQTAIYELVCSLLCSMYYNYLGCLMYKPEYKESCFTGIKYFYDNTLKIMKDKIPVSMIIDFYNMTAESRFQRTQGWQPYKSTLVDYTFLKFLDELENQ